MLLAIDVGNTQTVFGVYDGESLRSMWRVATNKNHTPDELRLKVLPLLDAGGYDLDAINGAVSEYGRKVGFPTPMNDRVVEIIHRIEQGELKPCLDNLKYFN